MSGDDPYDLAFGPDPEHGRLRDFFHYWNDKRGGREMPARADLEPLELKALLPHMILLDVEQEPLRFRYRLVGTGVTSIRSGTSKSDPTGRYVDEVTHHQGTTAVLDHYRRVVTERKPSLECGVYDPSLERPWRRFARLALPLSADGETIDMVVVVLVPIRE